MGKSEILTALDIGSGRVTCIIAECDGTLGKIRVLGGGFAECKGLKTGMVINIEEVARAIETAVDAAERKANQVVSEVLLGVRGPHLQSLESRGRCNIARTDQEIMAEDVTDVIENAKTFQVGPGLNILHVIPQKFSLDRLAGVPNPIGMEGALLEVDVHIVLASSTAITNLLKAVSAAGLRLTEDPIYTLLAMGELVISDEEKELGTVLIDIGGQTTSLGIYANGAIHFSKELPLGGDNVTRDLAYGLTTTIPRAKELKEKYGAVLSSLVDPDQIISVTGMDKRDKREVQPRELLKIIQPRIEEFYETIFQAVQKSEYADLPGGAVLAGGGALLKGMPEAAKELLEVPRVRMAVPIRDILDCPDEYTTQSYLGAVSLVCYPHLKTWNTDLPSPFRRGGILKKAFHWLEDFF